MKRSLRNGIGEGCRPLRCEDVSAEKKCTFTHPSTHAHTHTQTQCDGTTLKTCSTDLGFAWIDGDLFLKSKSGRHQPQSHAEHSSVSLLLGIWIPENWLVSSHERCVLIINVECGK